MVRWLSLLHKYMRTPCRQACSKSSTPLYGYNGKDPKPEITIPVQEFETSVHEIYAAYSMNPRI